MTHKPAFLVVATRSSARRLGARLSTHALTEVVSSVTEARALLLKNSRAHVLRRLAKGDHELLPVQVLLTTGADALVKATTGKLAIGDEVATDASLYAGDGASETAGEP